MKKLVALCLAMMMVFTLAACGGGGAADDPNVGLYEATSVLMMGMELAPEEVFEEGVSLELKNNGRCTLSVDGDSANGKWSIEDNVFKLSGGGVDETGTIEDGIIVLENLQDSGVTLVFEKVAA